MNELKNQKHKKRVTRNNKIAGLIITSGGYGIILSIAAILLFLIYKSFPLFSGAKLEEVNFGKPGSDKILLTGIDKFQEIKYLLFENGRIDFSYIGKSGTFEKEQIQLDENEKIVRADKGSLRNEAITLITSNNRIITAEIKMNAVYNGGTRKIIPDLEIIDEFNSDSSSSGINKFAYSINEDGLRFYGWTDSENNLWLKIYDAEEEEYYTHNLTDFLSADKISSLAVSHTGEILICGMQSGELFWFDISDFEEPELVDNWKAANIR